MNLYLVRNPDGESYLIQMHDEMDAVYNLNLGHQIIPKRICFDDPTTDEKDTECYEVVDIMKLIEM